MADRALIVCPEAPYPLHGGGPLRTAAMVHYLARRYTLDAVLFRQHGGADPAAALPAGLVAQSVTFELPYHSRTTVARVARNLRRWCLAQPPLVDRFRGFTSRLSAISKSQPYRLAVVEHFWCAPYIEHIVAERRVADLHNIESVWHARMANLEHPWLHRRFAAAYCRLEHQLLPRFDTVLVPSPADLAHLPPAARGAIYPNTIPWSPPLDVPKRERIIFSANMEYHPNISAVAWFAREVWPTLRAKHPDLEWVLAGRAPEAVRPLLPADPRIRLTGPLDDLTPEIAAAKVAIVPLRAGSGTRIKILEAWRAGTAVVSTPLGVEGLPAGAVCIAEAADEFVNRISSLLRHSETRRTLEQAGRQALDTQFTWEIGWKCLERLGI